MKRTEAENLLELGDLRLLKEDYQSTFDRIDEIADNLQNNAIDSANAIKDVWNETAGMLMSLTSVYKIFEEHKKIKELEKYMEIKNNVLSAGDKFVSASAEREARVSVTEFAKLRDLFASYIKSCEIAVNLFQSMLAYSRVELQKNFNE